MGNSLPPGVLRGMKKVLYIGKDDDIWESLRREARGLDWRRRDAEIVDQGAGRKFQLVIVAPDGEFGEKERAAMAAYRAEGTPFFVISPVETLRFAVQSLQAGAANYLVRSEGKERILAAVQEFLAVHKTYMPPEHQAAPDVEEGMVGKSPRIQDVFKLIGRIAHSHVSVLLRGESGTGKELVARLIHQNSPRRGRPFVVIDCAAIPHDLIENELFGHERGAYSGAEERSEGKFDLGNGGTVFMDEIAEMGLDLQSKILRVIQEGEFYRIGGQRAVRVDVRTIVATQSPLEELVRNHLFREDLYHRLNVITLSLPPLRERKGDIPLLVDHFVRKYCRELQIPEKRISQTLLDAFQEYHWPGNIRELENYVRRGLLMESGDVLTQAFLHHVPAFDGKGVREKNNNFTQLIGEKFILEELDWDQGELYDQMTSKVERVVFSLVLRSTKGNQVMAARILGISRNTLRVRLTELGLAGERFK
jgi:two-component system nitrogen regulation response regulator GlnG